MLAVLLLKTLRKNLFPRFFFLDPQNLSHSSTLLLAKGSNDESSPLITLTFSASLLGTLVNKLDPCNLLHSYINDICHFRVLL